MQYFVFSFGFVLVFVCLFVLKWKSYSRAGLDLTAFAFQVLESGALIFVPTLSYFYSRVTK